MHTESMKTLLLKLLLKLGRHGRLTKAKMVADESKLCDWMHNNGVGV